MAAKKPAERAYNYIYSKVVNEPNDIVGLIAYGLYKRKKIQYLEKFKQNHNRDPEDHELRSFHEISCQHTKEYRESAEILLRTSFIEANGLALERMQQDADEEVKARLKGTFLWSVMASVAGTVAVAVSIGVLVIALIGYNEGWSGLGKRFLKTVDTNSAQIAAPENPETPSK